MADELIAVGMAGKSKRLREVSAGEVADGVIPVTSGGLAIENSDASGLPSAARTTNQQIGPFKTRRAKALHVIVDLTVNAGGLGSITVTIQGIDPASGKTYTLLASAALTAVATTVYRIGPGLTAAANLVANDFLPANIQITVTANNANPVTYSVGYALVG